MTLEDKIIKIIKTENILPLAIKNWSWFSQEDCPWSIYYLKYDGTNMDFISAYLKIDLLIDQATEEECIYTDSNYVNIMKFGWLKRNNLKKEWLKKYRKQRRIMKRKEQT